MKEFIQTFNSLIISIKNITLVIKLNANMKISIVNKNCSFDNHYLVNISADSSIEIKLELERVVSSQSKKIIQDKLRQELSNELKNYKWLIFGKVQVEIHWYIDSVKRQETDKIGDLDNITKPLLDSLIGKNGILIDDSQINSIHTTSTTKNALRKDNIVKLFINFNNDYTVFKQNLFFLQTSQVIYTPLNFNINSKEDLKSIKFFIEAFKQKRVFSSILKNKLGVNLEEYLVKSDYEFHRTRLNGFDKNQIITDKEFDQICKKEGVDISDIINEFKEPNANK